MLQKIKHTLSDKGFVLTLVLALLALFFFYGRLLQNPNQVYFGATGDGLQAYCNAVYHVKFDQSYWHLDGLNYPYGEQVFFSGCQPFVTNTIKFISIFVDISDYTIGILNVIMLCSIVLSAIVLYLIFKNLKLSASYSALVSVAIAFLSPQMDRFGGHYSLTYQFAIPLFLLLLFKFYQHPSLKKSLCISFLVFFMAGTHFYFFGFFALISFFYWTFLFFSKQGEFGKLPFVVKHFFIQILLPFLFFEFIIFLIDSVHDRTHNPWGYLEYVSNLTGVFFPVGKPYSFVFESFIKPVYPAWEGYAFVGIVASVIAVSIGIKMIVHLLKGQFRQIFIITDNTILNALFWGGIFALLLSFGYPFNIKGFGFLFDYAGLLRQLRGIARFSWIFYYVINIIVFYKIVRWASDRRGIVKFFGLSIPLFFVCYDAFTMNQGKQEWLNNRIDQLSDTENVLPENKWIKEIEIEKYQAIITLPYFHVGSENIWMYVESDIVKDVFIASMKTGLPTTSVILSRTSLGQTYKNIQLIKEPYRPLEIITDFKNTKPFLVMVREKELNKQELELLKSCKKITETPDYNLYELEVQTLKQLSDHLFKDVTKDIKQLKTFEIDGFRYSDSIKTFVYNGFEDKTSPFSFSGKGCFEGKIKSFNVLFKGSLPHCIADTTYSVSFWMDYFTEDVYPRSTIELAFMDSAGVVYGTEYVNAGRSLAVLDGKWALIETSFKLKNSRDQLSVTIWNNNFVDEDTPFRADEFLIKPMGKDLYKELTPKSVYKNNRIYIRK